MGVGKPDFLYFGCGYFLSNVLRLTVLYRVLLTSSVPGVWGEGGPICIALLLFSF
mgnify:CR=1 FL=1